MLSARHLHRAYCLLPGAEMKSNTSIITLSPLSSHCYMNTEARIIHLSFM